MSEEILKNIINPICLHCSALAYACRGLTIKDWRKAKGCDLWELRNGICSSFDELDLNDYIIGEDSPYGDRHEIRCDTVVYNTEYNDEVDDESFNLEDI